VTDAPTDAPTGASRDDPPFDLQAAADELARVVAGVRDDQLAGPTPCEDMTVRALIDHVTGLTAAFRLAAEKRSTVEVGDIDLDRWRELVPAHLDALVEAWREPSAWTGTTEAGGVTLSGQEAGAVALDEIVLHGWDLARSTGQDFSCDPVSTEVVLAFTRAVAEAEERPEGLFGDPVAVPDDAPPFQRALGFSGRDPGWAP
jgi:uncharacterized protein (TIGR03086 family)